MKRLADLLLLATLLCAVLGGLLFAGEAAAPGEVVTVLAGGGSDEVRTIVFRLRAPRVALALAVGAGLALAGAALQSMLANPLADPFLLGISGGGAAA
ncbi:MAG: iron chelate uptake ABC transporter family permease subunit, partial [Acidobacteriota bacterium]